MLQSRSATSNPTAFTRRRLVILALVSIAIAAAALLAVFAVQYFLDDGPLKLVGGGTEIRAEEGELYTWGMPFPQNANGSEIRIDSIDPVGVDGVEVVGVTLTYDVNIGAVAGYPPADYEAELIHPAGEVVTDGDVSGKPFVLLGVRLKAGMESGAIDGVRIRYHTGRRGYELVSPYSLCMMTPELYEQEQAAQDGQAPECPPG